MPDQPINVVRFQNKVRAMMGLRGENPVPTLAELLPVVAIESDRPEYSLAGLELLAGRTNTQPAVVGNLSMVGLRNPANSGVVAIMTGQLFDSITGNLAMEIRVRPRRISAVGLFTLTSTVVGQCRDTRWEDDKQVQATCNVITGTNPTLFGLDVGITRAATAGGPPIPHDTFQAILGPDSDVYFIVTQVNTQLRGDVQWYERALERGLPS